MTAKTMDLQMTKQETTAEAAGSRWGFVYRVGAVVALSLVLFTAIQVAVFVTWPPPSFQPTASAVTDWFSLLQKDRLIGLLDLDLLMLVDYPANLLVFVALYVALRRSNPSLTTIALALGATGIASYFAVNPAFGMAALSDQFAAATTDVQRTMSVAAGQATLAIFAGSAFITSYELIAVGGLVMSLAMLKSEIFSRSTAYVGILFYAMNLVPASAGTLGLVLSLSSLVPMVIWLALVARRLFQLAREER